MPTKPSAYVSMVVQPVIDFTKEHGVVLAESNRQQWVLAMLQVIAEQ